MILTYIILEAIVTYLHLYLISYLTVDVDYTAINSQVIFTPTNQGQTLCRSIPVDDDLICEADETISVSVTTADPAVILSPSSALVTIIDNDGKFLQQ